MGFHHSNLSGVIQTDGVSPNLLGYVWGQPQAVRPEPFCE